MKRAPEWILAGVIGLLLGVTLSNWKAFPSEDMVARASCAECHDVHGALEIADAPFQSQIWILGDVREATYVIVDDLFPYAEQEQGTSISLPTLLERYDAGEWSRVAIESLDGGLVILDREYVTEDSLLVPYLEGARFIDRNQHESTWLKGVRWVVVVGHETPLRIGSQRTSLGRLLLGERASVVAEGAQAMYRSEENGRTYRGEYAHVYTGASVRLALGDDWSAEQFRATDARGQETLLSREELEGAIVATVNGVPALVRPSEGRGGWVLDLVALEGVY